MTLEGTQQMVEATDQDPLAETQSVEGMEGVETPEPTEEEGKGAEPKAVPKSPELTLEQIQKHPAYSELHSKVDRLTNVTKHLTQQWEEAQQTISSFRQKETDALIAQYGDSPEIRSFAAQKADVAAREAKLALDEIRLAPVAKAATCSEIMAEYGIPEEYRADLMAVTTDGIPKPAPGTLARLMEERAKVLKSVLGRVPQKPVANQSKRAPALSHIPDKAQGSVSPQSVSQLQDDYISGKISYQVYEKKMIALGKQP